MIVRVGTFYGCRATGPKWYVDSVAGNDTNSGCAPGAALRTIAAVLSRIAAGDIVGLARGSAWREQFTVPADHVQVVAYGAGNRPLLDCSDSIAPEAWSKTAGQTNVYQCSVTHDTADGKTFIGCWEDGTRLQWKTSVADVDATEGSYTLSDTSASPPSPVTLYVHAFADTNPATDGKLYEYSKRNHGLTATGRTGCVIRGIETRRNMHNDGSLILGNFNTVSDCVARDGSYHNVFVSPGCNLDGVIADGAFHPTGIGMFIWNPTGNGEDITFENCQALLPTFVSGVGGGFGGHGSGGLGTITYKNCVVRNCDEAFEGSMAARLVIDNCHITGQSRFGIASYDATDISITNLTVDLISTRLLSAVANGAAISIAGLTATSSNGATAIFLNGVNNVNLTVTDSTIAGFQVLSSSGNSGLNLTFLRNQIPSGPYNIFWLDPVPTAMNSDYNTVYGGAHVQWGSSNYTWAAYKTASGQDSHSTP